MALGATAFTAVTALVVSLVIAGSVDEDELDGAGGDLGTALNAKKVPPPYRKWVAKAGKTCPEVSAPLIAAQIEAESNWNPKAQSRDIRTGQVIAQGIAQFIPGTWASWGMDGDGDGRADVFTPADAIMTQARYDCWLAKKVKSYKIKGDMTRLMLAAYNAGPDAVRRYGGVPPYPETLNYVDKIMKLVPGYSLTLDDGGPASAFGQRVATHAKRWIGTPYSWGGGGVDGPSRGFAHGASTVGFDCSSLTQYAVYHASKGAVTLPRTSQIQVTQGKPVTRDKIRAGDLIGFALHGGGNFDHIAVYIGNGQFVHAPRTGQTVKIESLDAPYYASKPQSIRRYG